MLGYITVIFSCQLIGELIVLGIGLPLPGPVVGMVLLLSGLLLRGKVPDDLATVGNFLLGNISLLFVPAGVGILLHVDRFGREWLPLSAALVVSTLLTIGVTALVMQRLGKRQAP